MKELPETARKNVGQRTKRIMNLDQLRNNVINADTRKRYVNLLFGIFACLVFLHHIYVTIYYQVIDSGVGVFSGIWIVFCAITFLLGLLWKDKAFWILLLLLLLRTLRINSLDDAAQVMRTRVFILGLYAYIGCYGFGRIFKGKDLYRFLSFFCFLWTIATVVFSGIGIYVAWTGNTVPNLGNRPFYIFYGRLRQVYHQVEAGILQSASIAVALTGLSFSRNRFIKCIYIISISIILVASVLTGTRGCYILNAVSISCAVYIYLHKKIFNDEKNKEKNKKTLWKLILIVSFCCLVVLLSFAQTFIVNGLNILKAKGSVIVSQAYAEADSSNTLSVNTRGFSIGHGLNAFLNGRIDTWKSVFITIKRNPWILLWGESTYETMASVDIVRSEMGLDKIYHTHNVLLQTLLENGLPGLILLLTWAFVFLRSAVKLTFNGSLPIWKRIAPLPTIICIIADMFDITGIITAGLPQMTILYLFAGITVALAHSINGAKDKPHKEPV